MTTLTDCARTCDRSGLYRRHCDCGECEETREEYRELHLAKANVFLSERGEREKEIALAGIVAQIRRYEAVL